MTWWDMSNKGGVHLDEMNFIKEALEEMKLTNEVYMKVIFDNINDKISVSYNHQYYADSNNDNWVTQYTFDLIYKTVTWNTVNRTHQCAVIIP